RQVFAFFPESGSAPPWLINRSSFGDTWDDSYTLNAGSFTAGVRYRVVLTFDIYSDFDSTSVPGAEGVAMYSRQLQFYMNAIPEPSTVALIAGCVTLVAALYLRRRKSA
ncbi:MAG: PEP-CTERM sorting domain-containing protein, partial [Verrucomicrobiota bacterium]